MYSIFTGCLSTQHMSDHKSQPSDIQSVVRGETDLKLSTSETLQSNVILQRVCMLPHSANSQTKTRGGVYLIRRWIREESCCPLSSFRKYFKRLKQSITQFWAVMLITRNTIKRHHWRKVDIRQRYPPPPAETSLGYLATSCLIRLLCYKSLLQLRVHHLSGDE